MSKAPKWQEEWKAFVGNNKFLRIKKWEDYQTKYTTQYIYDYVDKEWVDEDYGTMPEFCRYVIDGMRRLRGKLRQNISSVDTPQLVCSALRITPKNRHNVPAALLELARRRFLIPTNERDRDSEIDKRRVKESREKNNDRNGGEPSATPVQVKQEEGSLPARRNGTTNPAHGSAPDAPDKPKKLGFDPYAIEPWDGWTADDIRLVVCYWWEHAKDTWFRDSVNTQDYFRKKFSDMAARMPKSWQPPKKPAASVPKQADPNCPQCQGTGEYKIDKPGYPKGMYFQRVICPCVRELA